MSATNYIALSPHQEIAASAYVETGAHCDLAAGLFAVRDALATWERVIAAALDADEVADLWSREALYDLADRIAGGGR